MLLQLIGKTLRKIIFIFILYRFKSKKNLVFFDLNFRKIDFTNYYQVKTYIFKERFYNLKNNDNFTLSEFMNHLKYFHNNSIVAINNIHQSNEMEEVWRKIITQKEVTISIDLFFCDIVEVKDGRFHIVYKNKSFVAGTACLGNKPF